MRNLLIPFFLLTISTVVHAAEPASATLPVALRQAQALGIEVQSLMAVGAGLDGGLPAQVQIPNEQLRIVAAPLAGMVVQVDAAPGQSVRKGQMLARLASPALLAAERDYVQAAQQAQLAAQAASRDEQLFREGIIAESRYQESRSAHRQAAVGVGARREELRLAGVPDSALVSLEKSQRLSSEVGILAPIDGIVLEQHVQVGQRVEAASPLFRIGKLSPLWLDIQVPATLAPKLQEGLTVLVPSVAGSGKVINVGRTINPASQTISVRARLDSGTRKLISGQMVEAMLSIPADSTAFRVALSSVVYVDGKAFVFVAEADGFRPLAVKATPQADQRVLLESPSLRADMSIAVKGLASLKSIWLAEKDRKAE